MTRTLYIAVTATASTSNLHPDDQNAPGLYIVEGIDSSLSNGDAADTALASFHAHQGIAVLDSFNLTVLDPETKEVLEANYKDDRDELDCEKLQEEFDSWMEASIFP